MLRNNNLVTTMANNFFLGLVFISLAGIVSCGSGSSTLKQEPRGSAPRTDSVVIPFSQALPLPHNRSELRCFRAECDVDASADAGSVKGSSTISILRSDSLFMSLHGPFGILIGKLSASPTTMTYLDLLKQEIIEGNPQSEQMQSKLPIPLSYNDLVYLMRCEVPYAPTNYQLRTSDEVNNSQLFAYSGDERFVDFVKLSTKDTTITTYQRKSRSGEVLFNVNYNEFTVKNGVRYPVSISLQFPQRKATARFTVTDLRLNPEGEKYWFAIPKGVKRTKLD